ncbi:MAG: iron chelate uptake ABC transporter family permease subunit [Candidatus Aegiribacteria sp.]|nr:iron chelate uptake ABC transporter family permease subunit [Candidatus Aegiribacteria sp.]MBD3294276.1 iron chelate uptake ABC transporter family permease subunit [Candidatus Fermentibacteria bacterium]
MHLEDGKVPEGYTRYTGRKLAVNLGGVALLFALLVVSISVGSVPIPLKDVLSTLLGFGDSSRWSIIVLNIRLPQALAAVAAGAGLSVSGAAMQSILRNPLGSPFTLGISNAAAFGAAFSVMVLGTGVMHSTGADALSVTKPYMTTISAFAACVFTALIILAVARIRRSSPEVMVLTGVALGALFSAGTMFLQYFADDVQLAAIVFWTFGDLGRASWRELAIISAVTAASSVYFIFNRWNYNAIDAGEETAKGLGVPVERKRLAGMLVASMVTATIISFVGVIGFVGLVCPHIVRRILGDDHRYLVPGSMIAGGIVLLAADTVARTVLAPRVLPVAVLTAFVGAPVFIFLLVRGYRR